MQELQNPPTEAEIIAGAMMVTVGGQRKRLPTLKIRPARIWKTQVADFIANGLTLPKSDASAIAALAKLGADTVLDLIVGRPESGKVGADDYRPAVYGYDQSGALGGREWLEENADDHEVYEILRTAFQVHFPFVNDLRSLATAFRELMGAAAVLETSAPEKPTNGLSPSGDSTPIPLKSVSPTASSTSSGSEDKSA
jgi:hypothetical protein